MVCQSEHAVLLVPFCCTRFVGILLKNATCWRLSRSRVSTYVRSQSRLDAQRGALTSRAQGVHMRTISRACLCMSVNLSLTSIMCSSCAQVALAAQAFKYAVVGGSDFLCFNFHNTYDIRFTDTDPYTMASGLTTPFRAGDVADSLGELNKTIRCVRRLSKVSILYTHVSCRREQSLQDTTDLFDCFVGWLVGWLSH